MAFGGAATGLNVGGGNNILEITGLTLAANAGAFDATGAAADSGLLTTDQTPPANNTAIPAVNKAFGPGPGNWTQKDVDAIEVIVRNNAATSTPVWASKLLVGTDLQVGVYNKGAGALAALFIRVRYDHTLVR